jgi:hypothetical protein
MRQARQSLRVHKSLFLRSILLSQGDHFDAHASQIAQRSQSHLRTPQIPIQRIGPANHHNVLRTVGTMEGIWRDVGVFDRP